MTKAILFSLVFFFILCSAKTSHAQYYVTVTPSSKSYGNVASNSTWGVPVLKVTLGHLQGPLPGNVTFYVQHAGISTITPVGSTPALNTGTFTLGPSNPYILLDYTVKFPGATGFYPGNLHIKATNDPNLSTVFHYNATVVPAVGVSDYVQFMTSSGVGPSTFSPITGSPIPPSCPLAFCPINYSAKFFDYDGSGTTAVSWTWKVELYHTGGSYILPLNTPIGTNPSYSDLHINSPFTLPANYDWIRDANSNILTKVQVDNMDSDGFGHHTERLVGVKHPPNKTSGTLACSDGAPMANKAVSVQWWDSTGMLGSQTTTTDSAGHFEVGIDCPTVDRTQQRFVISSPGCSAWTIPTSHCWGKVGTLVCKQCGGCAKAPASIADWWSFDETAGNVAGDIARHPNQLLLSNGPTSSPGKVAGARCFDGQNDFATASDHPEINFLGDCRNDAAEPISIDAWVKTTSSGLQVILDKREKRGLNFLRGYSLFIENGKLGFQMATGTGHFVCNLPNAACSNYVSPASVLLNDGQWHFIAVTVSRCRGAVGRMYVDGNLVHTFTPRVGDLSNRAPLLIGRSYPVPVVNYFRGCLDELEIFKGVLSKAELDAIYQAGSSGKCKPSGPIIIKQERSAPRRGRRVP